MRIFESVDRHPRAADDVYQQIRAAILGNRLVAGSRLSVPSLAGELGVSRSPVREAVQRLVRDGLATEEAHRGAVVATLDPPSVLSLYEMREVLEGLAARLACERATADELDDLEATLVQHAQAVENEDHRQHMRLDMQFHAQVRAAARNEHLSTALERVQDQIAIAMLSVDVTWHTQALAEHQDIAAAIRSGSAARAEASARAHIARLRDGLADRARGSLTGESADSAAGQA